MDLPEYITQKEVKRVCKELHLKDWTNLTTPDVMTEEADIILKQVNTSGMDIAIEDFRLGLEVELEHGTRFPDANVTNNHPLLTGKIVLAHLKETLDYYKRLDVVEIEGDLLHAILAKDVDKIQSKFKKLINAQMTLASCVKQQL
jgi:hypothetical protein